MKNQGLDTAIVLSINRDTKQGVLVGPNDELLISNSTPSELLIGDVVKYEFRCTEKEIEIFNIQKTLFILDDSRLERFFNILMVSRLW